MLMHFCQCSVMQQVPFVLCFTAPTPNHLELNVIPHFPVTVAKFVMYPKISQTQLFFLLLASISGSTPTDNRYLLCIFTKSAMRFRKAIIQCKSCFTMGSFFAPETITKFMGTYIATKHISFPPAFTKRGSGKLQQ